MAINLSRRSLCDVGVCMSILTVCGYMCLCICVSAAQYHSITSLNVGQLSQNFIYRKPVIYAESREKHSVNSWYYLKTKLIIIFSIPEGHTGKIIVHTIDKIW